jgi:hypothetical protein
MPASASEHAANFSAFFLRRSILSMENRASWREGVAFA